MNNFKRICVLCVCGILLLSIGVLNLILAVYANNTVKKEQKMYSNATINDEFADNSVLVILNNEASLDRKV